MDISFLYSNKSFFCMNKQTDLEGQHNLILFYFVYMWWTLPPFELQIMISGPIGSSENRLFIQLWKR